MQEERDAPKGGGGPSRDAGRGGKGYGQIDRKRRGGKERNSLHPGMFPFGSSLPIASNVLLTFSVPRVCRFSRVV